jgi:hypothetical protein
VGAGVRKAFFFKKKKQKTFMFLGWCWGWVRDSDQKLFASFFQKKKTVSSANDITGQAAIIRLKPARPGQWVRGDSTN